MNDTIYQTPDSEIIMKDQLQTSIVGKWLALLGALLLLALPIGLVSSIVSMIEVFQTITLTGAGDPKVMAGEISHALISTILGLVLAFPGALLLATSIL